MTTTVYGVIASPPVRSVLFVAKIINHPVELKQVDVLGGEHLKPEFLKMNPLHTIPTIDDEGFILFESNAIVTYLADKYGKNDSLYPKDLKLRATVNQRLFFNNILFLRLRERGASLMRPGGDGTIPPEVVAATDELITNLDTLIGDNQWVAGTDAPTVADICLLCCFDALQVLVETEGTDNKPNLTAWLKRARSWAENSIDTYKAQTEEAKARIVQIMSAALGTK